MYEQLRSIAGVQCIFVGLSALKMFVPACETGRRWEQSKIHSVRIQLFFFSSLRTIFSFCIRKLKSEKRVKNIRSFPYKVYRYISKCVDVYQSICLPAVQLSYIIFILNCFNCSVLGILKECCPLSWSQLVLCKYILSHAVNQLSALLLFSHMCQIQTFLWPENQTFNCLLGDLTFW